MRYGRISIFVFFTAVFLFFSNVANSEALIRVNSGGESYTDGSGNLWSADYGYNTGGPYSTSDPISGTTDDVLYQSERFDLSTSPELLYSFDVPNGTYTVNLYFAELFSGAFGVGLRVFDVLIEGGLVLNNLDIYSEVGQTAALIKSFAVTVTDGQLNIEFRHEIENPKISAIEVINIDDTELPSIPTGLSGNPISSTEIDLTWNASTDTGGSGLAGYRVYRDGVEVGTTTVTSYSDTGLDPDTTYTYTVSAYDNALNESAQSSPVDVTTLSAGYALVRVNAGGGSYTDGSGNLWSADYGYNTGGPYSTSDPISGTTDDVLYQSERFDLSTSPELLYSFDVPNGTYTVNLYFAELFSGAFGVGLRVFDVLIEGGLVLNNLDIYSEVGQTAALIKSFAVTVTDGQLNIEFRHEIENPKISAIEVINIDDTELPSIPTGLSGNPISSTEIDLTWNASTDTGGSGLAGYRVYRDGVEVGTTTVTSYSDTGLDPDTTYTYTVSAYDNALNESAQSSPVDVTTLSAVDSEPPTIPTGLSGNTVSSSQIDLTWNASTDTGGSGLGGYKVYRDSVQVGSTTLTSYSDTGLDPETTYTYTVSAYDNALNESAQSSPIDVTTLSAGYALVRVNAGGGSYTDGSGNLWSADYGYNTGGPYSTSDPISGTTDDVLYQSERFDLSTSPELLYSFDVPNGTYTVNLYFAELFSGAFGVGLRVFDVLIEGGLVLNNLDIYSEVGQTAALIKSFAVTVTDGQLNIEFRHEIENPKISAIEVINLDDSEPPTIPTGLSGNAVSSSQIDLTWNASTDTGGSGLGGYKVYRDSVQVGSTTLTSYSDTGLDPETTYTYTVSAYDNALNESASSSPVEVTTLSTGSALVRVNAGGGSYTDESGNLWLADYGYNTGEQFSTSDPINGTTDDALYQSERFDSATIPELLYSFDVPNGTYTVNLYFAELYSGAFGVGLRVFDVLIEGGLVLNNLDVYSEVGQTAALMKSFAVTVTDGQLNIEFRHEIENPKISAIEVISASSVYLPISENFNDGNADGWIVIDESSYFPSYWEVISGQYVQQNSVVDSDNYLGSYHRGTYSYLKLGLGLTDYRLTASLTPLPGTSEPEEGNDVGVMFRYKNNDYYYRVSFNSAYGFARLEKKYEGQFTTLSKNARGYFPDQPLNLTIEVIGGLIKVYLNGDPLFSASDSDLTSGTIALYSEDKAVFDNVLIEEISTDPSIIISTPVSYSIETTTTDTVNVSAVVTNMPLDGSVEFVIDDSTSIPVSTFPYTAQFTGVLRGEHKLDAILRNGSNAEVARDTNETIGVLGDNYIAVGDSITNGIGDDYSFDNMSNDERIYSLQGGYESNLNNLLTNTRLYPNIIFKEGVPGDQSYDAAYLRIDSILERYPKSNKVLILLGTNDSYYLMSGLGCTGQACDGTFKQNMQILVDKIVASGKTPVVGLVPPVFQSSDPLNTTRNQTIQEYNSVISNELTDIVPGPDLFSYFLSPTVNRSSLFGDPYHPNSLGHVVNAHLWNNALTGSTFLPFVLNDIVPGSYKQNLIELGNKYYIDIDVNYTLLDVLDNGVSLNSIPTELIDGRWINTANSDKDIDTDNFLSFYADRNVTVYVAYDAGATLLPDWLSTFTETTLQFETTDPATPLLDLYRADNMSGNITLGGNKSGGASGALSNYIVIVVEN
jgi:chitodextrinase